MNFQRCVYLYILVDKRDYRQELRLATCYVSSKMKKEAESIGGIYAVYAVIVGIICIPIIRTALLMTVPRHRYQKDSPLAIFDIFINYPVPSFSGLMTLILVAYLLGRRAGRKIIIEKRDALWVSFSSAVVALFACYIVGSIAAWLRYCITDDCKWEDEYIKYAAVGSIFLLAIIPTLFIALMYGSILKKKGEMTKHNTT
jgi:hypothetical protein